MSVVAGAVTAFVFHILAELARHFYEKMQAGIRIPFGVRILIGLLWPFALPAVMNKGKQLLDEVTIFHELRTGQRAADAMRPAPMAQTKQLLEVLNRSTTAAADLAPRVNDPELRERARQRIGRILEAAEENMFENSKVNRPEVTRSLAIVGAEAASSRNPEASMLVIDSLTRIAVQDHSLMPDVATGLELIRRRGQNIRTCFSDRRAEILLK